MRVQMLNVGWMTTSAGIWRKDEEKPERPVRLPVPAYLIESERARILVDTGLHPGAVADKDSHYEPGALAHFVFEQEESIADQVDLSTLTMVVLTHLHFDHAGGLSLLPGGVPIVVQRGEWEAGGDRAAVARNFLLPKDYAWVGEDRLTLVDGDHDLLGDGSVELLHTPGHTPGHQSIRVGELVIGADVVYYASGLDDHRFPIFGDNHLEQAQSAERLRRLREQGMTVQPGHDPEVLRPGPLSA